MHDTDSVEFYSLGTKTFQRYNAKLCIARNQASACFIEDYVYVVGGHTVKHPNKFINTIERCHKSVPSSYFEQVRVRQTI